MKVCRICKKRPCAPSGSRCNPCRNPVNKEYYQRTKTARLETRRIWRRDLRMSVLSHYGGICACCGEDELEFLGIDHIKGGGNQHRKGLNVSIYYWLRKNGFPQGFRVLCHNCNLASGFYGVCPHQKK